MTDERLYQDNADGIQELQNEPEELFEHHRITVDKGQEMMRLDKYLQMRLEGISRNKIQAAAKAGCIVGSDFKPERT